MKTPNTSIPTMASEGNLPDKLFEEEENFIGCFTIGFYFLQKNCNINLGYNQH